MTPRWRNRNRADAQVLTKIYKDPTVSDDGTLLAHDFLYSSNRSRTAIGGVSDDRFEWVLYPERKYIVKVTPDADGTKVTIDSLSYEHPHKDWWWEQAVN